MGNTLTRTHDLIAGVHERERLEREVIEARKTFVGICERGDVENEYPDYREAYDKVKLTTRALNKFEAEHAGVEGADE